MDRRCLGNWGEEQACAALKKHGLKILERNYRCPLGEIDIIAREKKTLVFVEVKTRATEDFGDPSEAVDRRKRRHIARAAQHYLIQHGLETLPVRFDIVEVLPGEVRHIPDAFDATGLGVSS